MHAIAHHTRQTFPDRRVVYLSAEKFMYHFIRALRFQDTVAFKERFRSVDLLMIDDVQFINGKESTQEEFFHTFNDLVDNNRQLVISADKSPSDLEGMEERLRSRLGWGLVADIHATTFELRLGIMDAKADRLGVAIPSEVKEFLAHRITSNVRELEGALNRVVAHATLVGREISLETCQDVLHDVLRANDRRVTIEEIQKKVAEHFNISIPVKGHKHTVFNVSTQKEQLRNLPLVADLVTGVYLRPEGEDYIVGYDGNGEWSTDNLDPNCNSWNEVWEHLYHRFPNVFDAAKMEGAWAGYYDTSTIDNNAIIDNVNNIFFATGFTGRGLMHSPAVGLTLKQMILEEKLTFNIESLRLNRNPNFEKYVI